MADASDKAAENVPGKYYVDANCTACMVCCDTAPTVFKMTDDEDHAYVAKQPDGDEVADVEQARESCLEECIEDDGE